MEPLVSAAPTAANASQTAPGKTGVLLVNLGTPDSPSVPDVRKYLREFLMDGRVIDFPFLPRFLLVNGIIAPFRSPKSAKTYQELWTETGSPLKYYGVVVTEQVQQQLGPDYVVRLAMRYQSPSIEAGMNEFKLLGLTNLVVVPFFPQYASATTGSIYEKVMDILKTWQVMPALRFVNRFLEHPKFIQGVVERGRAKMNAHDYDHYIFSYHGLPERQIRKGDPTKQVCQLGDCCNSLHAMNQHCYRAQCFETTRRLVAELGIPEGKYTTCFQSRLGRDPWIKPYTEDLVKSMPKAGLKRVLAFSPAFVSDCLETTIEVGEEYKELFEENGGEHWELVDSLNDSPLWVETVVDLVLKS
jgi:protoporphyrin/coproporphyrin ferrochelatase